MGNRVANLRAPTLGKRGGVRECQRGVLAVPRDGVAAVDDVRGRHVERRGDPFASRGDPNRPQRRFQRDDLVEGVASAGLERELDLEIAEWVQWTERGERREHALVVRRGHPDVHGGVREISQHNRLHHPVAHRDVAKVEVVCQLLAPLDLAQVVHDDGATARHGANLHVLHHRRMAHPLVVVVVWVLGVEGGGFFIAGGHRGGRFDEHGDAPDVSFGLLRCLRLGFRFGFWFGSRRGFLLGGRGIRIRLGIAFALPAFAFAFRFFNRVTVLVELGLGLRFRLRARWRRILRAELHAHPRTFTRSQRPDVR